MVMEPILVACLCAERCGACRGYRETFEQLGRRFAGRARFAWIDIEDHAEVMGDVEVESFPTLLMADARGVSFFGPLAPHASTLSRLVERALEDELGSVGDAAVADLARRARALAGG
jgi:thioredoxin-like negative regulator of GroEL